ncbi:hypothetical protein MG290_08695 [Flavobacterium sp. CBA20B-1]|uniref:hypothetical protein n=1 Tax=unclassified Flavobacterium TaxID=196869 RepID=UPI0022255B8E|nr:MULTISPECIES: hypothetical protein [unclassified Flavobacterium]WCM41037.1 hypothetical protein MG290_08695 [Flavobacterium sp. CBA20B-1]
MIRIKTILLTIITVFVLQSCNVGTTGIWKDENIEQSLKNEIETLDIKVLEAVTTNNIELLKSMMSDKLLEKSGDNIGQLLEQASGVITTTDYKVLNQFHTKNSTTGIGNTVISGVSGLNDYSINYQALNEEMFISLLISKSGLDEFIVTNIYGKYPDGWKLNILHFGQYKVNDKTAPELYSEAKVEHENGYLINAANNMFLSSRVANPANNFWQYQKEEEMKGFYEKVMKEVNSKYKFPMTLEAIDSKPQILSIYPQGTEEGYFPMIEYVTNLDLKDTVQTNAEYEKVHSEIIKAFNGIEKNKDYVFYKAFSEIPNGKTPVPTYGFIKKLK